MASTKGASQNLSTTHETAETKRMLENLIEHVRQSIESVREPRAQALFETTAEVLGGLKTAYEHYEVGSETAFRR